ncbi:hypothetical protein [Streptomyces sp. YPW6]|uniref:hypothetical protein n=1 Tax=Streptomyces sp. YPW6 TaxID=2840373 RepID=UPI003D71E8EB
MTDTTPTPADRPADQLRAAAEKLRALLADLGDCRGPWYVVNREQRPYPQRIDNIGVPYVVASTTTDPTHPPTVADYICAMHPGVGLALAALLESAAERLGDSGASVAALLDPSALAVARQLLGTSAAAVCGCDPAPHREDDGTYSHWAGCPIADEQQVAELTAEEARDLVDELNTELYQAHDALAFVGECCDIADRNQRPITTGDVREWLKGARCGRQLLAASSVSERVGVVQTELLDAVTTGTTPPEGWPALLGRYRAAIHAAGVQPTTADRAATCICGHPEQQHFEDVCQTCDCGDFLVPEAAREMIAHLHRAVLAKRDGRRAAVLREAADECDKAGGIYASRGQNEHAGAAFALMETFRRQADEADYVATPCSVGACEPGGEPCTTHERLMAHAEGDHELCDHEAADAAAGVQPPTSEAHRPRRGDAVDQWLRAQREAAADYPEAYQVADGLLDLYRLHADMGIPLDGHACEARVIGDCECLEQPAAPAAPEEPTPC